jgi:hypothetical protein
MRNNLFNDEVEVYTNPSNIKFWILGTAVFAGAVFMGWVLNLLPKIVTFMDIVCQ